MYDRMCHIKVCNLLGFLTLIDLKRLIQFRGLLFTKFTKFCIFMYLAKI